jgi:hypothetical protein
MNKFLKIQPFKAAKNFFHNVKPDVKEIISADDKENTNFVFVSHKGI